MNTLETAGTHQINGTMNRLLVTPTNKIRNNSNQAAGNRTANHRRQDSNRRQLGSGTQLPISTRREVISVINMMRHQSHTRTITQTTSKTRLRISVKMNNRHTQDLGARNRTELRPNSQGNNINSNRRQDHTTKQKVKIHASNGTLHQNTHGGGGNTG